MSQAGLVEHLVVVQVVGSLVSYPEDLVLQLVA